MMAITRLTHALGNEPMTSLGPSIMPQHVFYPFPQTIDPAVLLQLGLGIICHSTSSSQVTTLLETASSAQPCGRLGSLARHLHKHLECTAAAQPFPSPPHPLPKQEATSPAASRPKKSMDPTAPQEEYRPPNPAA